MKKYILISPFLLGICCFIISTLSSSYVTANGTLVEPLFFLIPIGYIFILIGIVLYMIKGVISLYKRSKVKHNSI